MTEGRLDPRVRSMLQDALDDRDLEMDVAEEMLDRAQRLEGQRLVDELRSMLED